MGDRFRQGPDTLEFVARVSVYRQRRVAYSGCWDACAQVFPIESSGLLRKTLPFFKQLDHRIEAIRMSVHDYDSA